MIPADDTVVFGSDGSIDQLLQHGEVNVSIPAVSGSTPSFVPIADIAVPFAGIPVVDATWSSDGGTTWRQMGDNSIGGIYLDVSSSQIRLRCTYTSARTITLRWYLYADKVDY